MHLAQRCHRDRRATIDRANADGTATILNEQARAIRGLSNEAAHASQSASSMAAAISIASKALGALGVANIVSGIFSVNREMQSLRTSMITAAGSAEAATAEFEKLKNFKIAGVVGLKELAESYTRLKNLALNASETTITAYANIAAANPGKSTADFIEAVADAATGEMERLKEFRRNDNVFIHGC